MSLTQELFEIRGQLAAAAHKIYDGWSPDSSGLDDEFGGGGICDAVQRAMADVISSQIDCDLEDGGWEGDDHANLIVSRGGEECLVDIPAQIYETGGGMSWQKLPDVLIDAHDVIIAPL